MSILIFIFHFILKICTEKMLSKKEFEFVPQGWVHIKGRGKMLTYIIAGKRGFQLQDQPKFNNRSSFASVVYGMMKRRHSSAKSGPINEYKNYISKQRK